MSTFLEVSGPIRWQKPVGFEVRRFRASVIRSTRDRRIGRTGSWPVSAGLVRMDGKATGLIVRVWNRALMVDTWIYREGCAS